MHEIIISAYSGMLFVFGQNGNSFWKNGYVIGIITGLITGFAIWYFTKERRKKLKNYFKIINKKAIKLNPDEILGDRAKRVSGFREDFYCERNYDTRLFDLIEEGKNVLVIGEPLSGKTRLIYNTLKALGDYRLWMPNVVKFESSIFSFIKPKGKSIVLFDDINRYEGKEEIDGLITKLSDSKFTFLATCKSGPEFEIFENSSMYKDPNILWEEIEIENMDKSELKKVRDRARSKNINLEETQFNGTIGSLFYPLETMKRRFDGYDKDRKCVLRSLRKLNMSGIYEGRDSYSIERVRKVCKKEGMDKNDLDWNAMLEELKNHGFIRLSDKIVAEIDDVYFQNLERVGEIVSFPFEITLDDALEEMLELFRDDAKAIFLIGTKAALFNSIYHQVRTNKIAIKALELALNFYTIDKDPYNYAGTQNNLAVAYRNLSLVEDKAGNCKRAIVAYGEALKVHTLEAYPYDYAKSQNNLGNAYRELSLAEDKGGNCKRAIDAFEEALKVRTLEEFPYDYAQTQNNLGNVYVDLSIVKDKGGNCKRAIDAFEEALKVRTLEGFPYDYAQTQNNLGAAYHTLADEEDRMENLNRAIQAYDEALKIYTPDAFPYDYEKAKGNREIAVRLLSEE